MPVRTLSARSRRTVATTALLTALALAAPATAIAATVVPAGATVLDAGTAAPAPTVEPSISGTPRVGSTLTAHLGTWPAGTTLQYRWDTLSGRTSALTPAPSVGAPTLALTAADQGQSYRLVVVATLAGHEVATYQTAYASAVVTGLAPTATVAPSVSGTAKIGYTLTAHVGTWTPSASGASITYRWLRDGADITGATRSTYAPGTADVGHKVAVRVTVTPTGYATGTKTSVSTSTVVVGSAPKATVAPKISGTVKPGSTLKSTTGTWPSGYTYQYQWLANGSAIPGGTKSSITLTTLQVGKKISVRVTALRVGYANGSSTSSSTGAVPKSASTVSVSVPSSVRSTSTPKATVTIKTPGQLTQSGKVTVRYGSRSTTVTLSSSAKGKISVSLPKLAKGSYKVSATYTPGTLDAKAVTAKTSSTVTLKIV